MAALSLFACIFLASAVFEPHLFDVYPLDELKAIIAGENATLSKEGIFAHMDRNDH